jgi:WD40 repeat protein
MTSRPAAATRPGRDEPVIVSGGEDRTVRVWWLTDGTPIGKPLRAHDGWVRAVAAAALPDGTPVIVSGGDDRTVRVWRLTDGTPVGEPLRGHAGAVMSVAAGALPDGTPLIVSGGDDRTVRVWRLTDGTPVGSPWDLQAPVSAVAITGDLIVAATINDVLAIDLTPV